LTPGSNLYKDKYLEFLNQWGTHYIQGALLGGTAISRSEIDSSYTFSKSDKEVKGDVDVYFRAIKLKLDVDIHKEKTDWMKSYTNMANYILLGGDANAFAEYVEAPSQSNISQARIQKLAAWTKTIEMNPNQVAGETQLRNISDLISTENFPTYDPTKIDLIQKWLISVLRIDKPYEVPKLWACKFQGQVQHEDKDGFRYHNFIGSECSRGNLPLATTGTPDGLALINQQCVYGFASRADHCGFGSNLLWEVNGTQIKYRYQGYECNDQTEFEVHYLCVEGCPPTDLHHCHKKQFDLQTSGFQSIEFSPRDCTNNGSTGICYSTMPRMAYSSSDVVIAPTIASQYKVCPTGVDKFMLAVQNSTANPDQPTSVCLSVVYTTKLPGTSTNVIKQLQKCDASDPNQLFVLENATNPTDGGNVYVKHLTSGKCLSVTADKPNRVGVVDCTDTATNTKWIVNVSKPDTFDQTVTLGIKDVFDDSTLAMAYCPGKDAVCGEGGICIAVDSIPPTATCSTSIHPLHSHYHILEFKPICGGVTNWGLWGRSARPPPPYNLTMPGGLPVPPLVRNSVDNIPVFTFRGPANQASEAVAQYLCTNQMVGDKSFPKLHQCTIASNNATDMVGDAGKVMRHKRRWRKVTLTNSHCTNGLPKLTHGEDDSYISYSLRRTEEQGIMPINFVIQGTDIKWEDSFYQENTVVSVDYLVYDPLPSSKLVHLSTAGELLDLVDKWPKNCSLTPIPPPIPPPSPTPGPTPAPPTPAPPTPAPKPHLPSSAPTASPTPVFFQCSGSLEHVGCTIDPQGHVKRSNGTQPAYNGSSIPQVCHEICTENPSLLLLETGITFVAILGVVVAITYIWQHRIVSSASRTSGGDRLLGDKYPPSHRYAETAPAAATRLDRWQQRYCPVFVIGLSIMDTYFDCATVRSFDANGELYKATYGVSIPPYGFAYTLSMLLPMCSNLAILAQFLYTRYVSIFWRGCVVVASSSDWWSVGRSNPCLAVQLIMHRDRLCIFMHTIYLYNRAYLVLLIYICIHPG
jgi:hypothetical protein